MGKQRDFILGGSKITADDDCSHEIKRHSLLGRKAMTNLDSILKSRDHHFADKGPYSQSYGFSSSHAQMWELDHKEGWKWKSLSHIQLFATPTVHGILQARILEWVAYPFSRGSFQPRNQTGVSFIAGGFFTNCEGRLRAKELMFFFVCFCDAGELWRVPWTARRYNQ